MPIAFKEWAVTVRALAEGEQLLTLRKGGIREENKHFEVEHERFFLYPTFDHQQNNLVRESHHPELRRALEEGVWPDEEPPPRALIQDGGIPQPDRVRLRAWAEVTDHITITDPRAVDALSPFYIWTPDYAEKRLNWKRRHPLHILLLRVHRIPRPVTVRVRDEYHGCRSWVEIDRDLPFEGTPVMADEEFDRARAEIREVCGDAEPASGLTPHRRLSSLDPMPWVETESLSFTARHDSGDSAYRRADAGPDGGPAAAARGALRGGPRATSRSSSTPTRPADDGAPVPARRALVGGARRPPLPRRLGDGAPSSTSSTTLDGAPRRRRGLARGAARHRRAALRQLVVAANNPALPPSWTPAPLRPLPALGLAGRRAAPSTSPARSASTGRP